MPNRIIKESICTSETVDALTWFEEVVWYRLIVNCDDYGRMDGRIPVLRSRLFPLKGNITDKSVMEAINHLATVGLVKPYKSDGKPILQIVTWDKHQQVRAKRSKYPAPDGEEPQDVSICNQLISDDSICPRNPIQSESVSESVSESECENPAAPPAPTPRPKKVAPVQHKRGQYGWVLLSDDEYARLVEKHGLHKTEHYIKHVDESAQSTGNRNGWKDWNLTVQKAIRDGWGPTYVEPTQNGRRLFTADGYLRREE